MSMLSELLRPGNGHGSDGGDNRFLVNLTPTSMDFSGVMDKTTSEIYEAWQAGKEIWFAVNAEGGITFVRCTMVWENQNHAYPSFNAFIINDNTDTMIYAFTGSTDDESNCTYGTRLYPISPLSM